jgi:alpha-beta hydrolase superfamily lysophospholipase
MNIPETYYYRASSNEHDIRALIWKPKSAPKAIIQIIHGMAEHIERYNDFAGYLNQFGFIVCGNDHAGHGESVNDKKLFGFFAEKDGEKHLLEDVHSLRKHIQSGYPEIPYFLLGHSMGSLIGRLYISQYDPPTEFICMGTSGGNIFTGAGIMLASLMIKIRGKYAPGKLLNAIAFGNFNRKIRPKRTPNDWLSRDENEVDKYNQDKKCGFLFTTSGYRDLFKILKAVSLNNRIASIPDIPMLIISGTDDPVGNYGKGVRKFVQKLQLTEHKHVQTILYKNARHEILNEINRKQVYDDILKQIKKLSLDTQNTKQ